LSADSIKQLSNKSTEREEVHKKKKKKKIRRGTAKLINGKGRGDTDTRLGGRGVIYTRGGHS